MLGRFLLLMLLPLAVLATGFHDYGSLGYFRSNAGMSLNNETQACFANPDGLFKYRLGNECDRYLEFGVYDRYYPLNEDGPYFETLGEMAWSALTPPFGYKFAQLYVEAGQLPFSGNAKWWVGRRYYDRRELHIVDFKWLDMSGDGAGVYDIDLPYRAKLALALVRDSSFSMYRTGPGADGILGNTDDTYALADVNQTSLDVRIDGLRTNPNGELMLWFAYAYSDAEHDGSVRDAWDGSDYDDQSGWAVGVSHYQSLPYNGFNVASVQYGEGLMRKFSANGMASTYFGSSRIQDAHTFRITNQNVFDLNSRWSLGTLLFFQDERAPGINGIVNPTAGDIPVADGFQMDIDRAVYSVGGRVYYYVNNFLRVAGEVGYDYVDDEFNGRDGGLAKLTFAAELSPGRGFWTRPAMRLYVTNAWWDDDYKGLAGATAYSNETYGATLGIQIDTWW